jgi:tetratricopeptide (TPR) repeat protein
MAKCDQKLAQVKENPAETAIIYNLKGQLFMAQKMTSRAEESFQAALKANPDYLQPYYALARLYLAEKKSDLAIGQLQAALEANPKQVGPHMLLAIIFDSQKRFDRSEKHYRAVLDMNPDFAPAANNLAFLLAEQDKNLDEALRLAQVAKEKLPEDPNVMDTLGWAYYKKGIYDMAIVEFGDALEKKPDNPAIIFHLGMAYYQKGDRERAKKELQAALSISDSFMGAAEAKRILSGL